jgi:hypothetical protein
MVGGYWLVVDSLWLVAGGQILVHSQPPITINHKELL